MDARALVAWNIRRLRVEQNISQDELALRSGVERAYFGHLERGQKNPTVVTLEKIAHALECELAELFETIPKGIERPAVLTGGRKRK